MYTRTRNSKRYRPLTTTGPDTLVYASYNNEYTVNRHDAEGTEADPWVVRFHGEVIGTRSKMNVAMELADAHQNKEIEKSNAAAKISQDAYDAERAELAKQPGMTVEELLAEPEGGGVALVSADYGVDEAQLVRNKAFQKIALEPPVGYRLPATIDRHGFTMMLNRTCQDRGIGYSFIGSPRKAMREIRRLFAVYASADTVAESDAAADALGWEHL